MNIAKHFTKLTGGLLAGVLCLLGASACDDEKGQADWKTNTCISSTTKTGARLIRPHPAR